MQRYKKFIGKTIGPGGVNCPCCGPPAGSKARKKVMRTATKQDKRQSLKEEMEDL